MKTKKANVGNLSTWIKIIIFCALVLLAIYFLLGKVLKVPF